MDYSPLENIPDEIQKKHYSLSLSFMKEQKELETLLRNYKNTYSEYVSVTNRINSDGQWVVESGVMADVSQYTPINDTYPTNISQNQCILECLRNPHCDFILFSDSGNGECAANRCLKFSKAMQSRSANGKSNVFYKSSPMRYSNDACTQNGSGPAYTDYVFNGWQKPIWHDMSNTSLKNKSELGTARSLQECKNMALSSEKNGPHYYIEYDGSASSANNGATPNCFYSTSADSNLQINPSTVGNGPIVSVASPENAQNMQQLQQLVVSLNKQNQEIYTKMSELDKHNKILRQKNVTFENKYNMNMNDFQNAYSKLAKDRTVLQRLQQEIMNQDGINENLNKEAKMNKTWLGLFGF